MEFTVTENRIAYEAAGKVLAEVTFPAVSDGVVELNHTFVDDSLRGQGVAGKLMVLAAEALRADGRKAKLSCSYAVGWFAKHLEYGDILAP